MKRDMKKFTQTRWMECLAKQELEPLGNTEDASKITDIMSQNVNKALDECAPYKKVTIRHSYDIE